MRNLRGTILLRRTKKVCESCESCESWVRFPVLLLVLLRYYTYSLEAATIPGVQDGSQTDRTRQSFTCLCKEIERMAPWRTVRRSFRCVEHSFVMLCLQWSDCSRINGSKKMLNCMQAHTHICEHPGWENTTWSSSRVFLIAASFRLRLMRWSQHCSSQTRCNVESALC